MLFITTFYVFPLFVLKHKKPFLVNESKHITSLVHVNQCSRNTRWPWINKTSKYRRLFI